MFRLSLIVLCAITPALTEKDGGYHRLTPEVFIQKMSAWADACTSEGHTITKVKEGTLTVGGIKVPFYAYKGQWTGKNHMVIAFYGVPDKKDLLKFTAIGKVPHNGECHISTRKQLVSQETVFINEEKEVFTLLIIEAPLPDKKAEKKLLALTLKTLKKAGAIK